MMTVISNPCSKTLLAIVGVVLLCIKPKFQNYTALVEKQTVSCKYRCSKGFLLNSLTVHLVVLAFTVLHLKVPNPSVKQLLPLLLTTRV